MNKSTQKLLKDLKHFGLNPSDWIPLSPIRSKDGTMVIGHKKEKSFKLLAFCEQGFCQGGLKKLSLYSV